LTWDYH